MICGRLTHGEANVSKTRTVLGHHHVKAEKGRMSCSFQMMTICFESLNLARLSPYWTQDFGVNPAPELLKLLPV